MLKHITACLIFTVAALYITFPLVLNLGKYSTGLSDELLIAWIHGWVMQALSIGNILSIFDANIYYPFKNTLAYSDFFLTTSILSFLPTMLVGEAIAANNFIIIFSLGFLGFSVYVLSYYLTKDFLASIFVGLLVIFSPVVLSQKVHIQMLAIGFVPLSVLFFLIFLKQQKTKYLCISLLLFLLQTYNSFLPGYFILFSYLISFVFYYLNNKNKSLQIITVKNIFVFVISMCLVIPIAIPYYQVSKEFNYTRDIRESIHLALQPEDLLYTSNDSRLESFLNNLPFNKSSQNNEFKPGFLGMIFTMSVLFAVWYLVKKIRKKDFYLKSFLTISIVGLILSFGPILHLGRQTIHDPFPIPLPYALFYYVLPGFQGFRNSARWEVLFILAIAVVVAIVFHLAFKKFSLRKRMIVYAILIVGIIGELNLPMNIGVNIPQKKDFPKVYSWVANTPTDTTIIELPIYTWNMQPYVFKENMREYYSTVHFRKMVNGASGFSPEPWQNMVIEIMTEFPQEESIKKLKAMDIDYIILHKREYDEIHNANFKVNDKHMKDGNTILKILSKNKEVSVITKFDDDYVIKIK